MAQTSEKAVKPHRPDWLKNPKLVAFITKLAQHGNVSYALNGAGIKRAWVYEKRAKDAEFAEAFEDARRCGLEILKDEAWRRAYEGVEEPVFYEGEQVDHIRKYSDVLLMFLIKQHDPSYRERFEVEHGNAGGRPFLFQMMLHPDVAKATK